MKVFKYVPSDINVLDKEGNKALDKDGKEVTKASVFEGHLMVRVPKYQQRLELIKSLNLKVSDKKDDEGSLELGDDEIESALRLAKVAEDHIAEVDLKLKSTKEEYKTIDDLSYTQEGTELINHVANLVLQGFTLGKA